MDWDPSTEWATMKWNYKNIKLNCKTTEQIKTWSFLYSSMTNRRSRWKCSGAAMISSTSRWRFSCRSAFRLTILRAWRRRSFSPRSCSMERMVGFAVCKFWYTVNCSYTGLGLALRLWVRVYKKSGISEYRTVQNILWAVSAQDFEILGPVCANSGITESVI